MNRLAVSHRLIVMVVAALVLSCLTGYGAVQKEEELPHPTHQVRPVLGQRQVAIAQEVSVHLQHRPPDARRPQP